MTGAKVLVVDDEVHIRRLLEATLTRAGYAVTEAMNARDALDRSVTLQPDAILLDLGLPDRDGLELVPLLKAKTKAAVLVVSARDATEQKVAALDLGADDYVQKPFDSEELLARLRAALRNRLGAQGAEPVLRIGGIEIDLVARRLLRDGAEVHLTRKEYDVLGELAKAPGRVITHRQMLQAVWPNDHEARIDYLRIVIRNLRQKLEADPARPAMIVNELGVGYRLLGQG